MRKITASISRIFAAFLEAQKRRNENDPKGLEAAECLEKTLRKCNQEIELEIEENGHINRMEH